MTTQKALENGVFVFNISRSMGYALQQWSLPILERVLFSGAKPLPKRDRKELEILYRELLHLLKRDAYHVSKGDYPMSVLKFEAPWTQWLNFAKVVMDGRRIQKRRKTKSTKDFHPSLREDLAEYPEYYQRNFHFQTDGYLSEESAALYDAQVDILFAGAADAMRRLIIPLMKKRAELKAGPGQRLKFLEVGAGSGNLTRSVRKAYPRASIVAMDLSASYLERAKVQVPRLETVVGAGEDLPFRDETFDAVYSCFVFHEIPLAIRRAQLKEAFRVLKPDGYIGIVDSLQKDDQPRLNWALENFPKDFHEPFYKDYTLHPVRELMEEAGFQVVEETQGFLAKALLAKKGKKILSD